MEGQLTHNPNFGRTTISEIPNYEHERRIVFVLRDLVGCASSMRNVPLSKCSTRAATVKPPIIFKFGSCAMEIGRKTSRIHLL